MFMGFVYSLSFSLNPSLLFFTTGVAGGGVVHLIYVAMPQKADYYGIGKERNV